MTCWCGVRRATTETRPTDNGTPHAYSDVLDYRGQPSGPTTDMPSFIAGVKYGAQLVAFETYGPNLAATAAREAAEVERQQHARWHE